MNTPIQIPFMATAPGLKTSRGYRLNHKWEELQPGDPVVSDYCVSNEGKFRVFLFNPLKHDKTRTDVTYGALRADLCFPYGELTDRLYEDRIS